MRRLRSQRAGDVDTVEVILGEDEAGDTVEVILWQDEASDEFLAVLHELALEAIALRANSPGDPRPEVGVGVVSTVGTSGPPRRRHRAGIAVGPPQQVSTTGAGRAGRPWRGWSNGVRAVAVAGAAVVLASVGIIILAAWILISVGVGVAIMAVVVGALATRARAGRTLGLAAIAAGCLTIYGVARLFFG